MALLFPLWGTKQDAANQQLENLADGTKLKDAVNLSQLQAAVAGGIQFIGPYNAATNTPDLTTSPNSIVTGDLYVVDTPGTFFGENLEVGDNLYAVVDDPSSLSDWAVVQNNIDVPVYVNDYYVSSDNTFASDTNTGLSEFSPLLTLGKALDLGQASGTPFSIHILDNKTYTVTTVAAGERVTTVEFSIVGNGATIIGDGVVWKMNKSRIDGMNVDGTSLTIRPTGSGAGGQIDHLHRWFKISNPETLYRTITGDPVPHRWCIYANRCKGTGSFADFQNASFAFMHVFINDMGLDFSSGVDEYAFIGDGASVVFNVNILNFDVTNTGAGDGVLFDLKNGGRAFCYCACVGDLNGGNVDTGAKLNILATNPTGMPLTYNDNGGAGTVHDSSLSQGLNFENLAALAAPALTDIINIRDLATGDQKKTTLSELKGVISPGTYTESMDSISTTSSGAWVERTLAGSENKIIEVMINTATQNAFAGVRAKSSSLARLSKIDGDSSTIMTVQLDGDGKFEIYSDALGVTFDKVGQFN